MDIPYFAYVLYSHEHGRYYVGSSADPKKRLLSHNDQRNNGWTKRYTPWEIIYTEKFDKNHLYELLLNTAVVQIWK